MKIILSEHTLHLLENYQLAQKYFVKTGEINQEDLDELQQCCDFPQYLSVYVKLFLTLPKYDELKKRNLKQTCEALNDYYKDTSLLQIEEFSNPIDVVKNNFIYFDPIGVIVERNRTLKNIRNLDSFYLRNIKKFLNTPKKLSQVKFDVNKMESIINIIKTYDDYPDSELKRKIINTAFSSKIQSLKEIVDFLLASYEEDLHHQDIFSSEDLFEIIKSNNLQSDLEIFYDKNNKVFLKVYSQQTLRVLTCNSGFCFSRSNASKLWDKYAGGSHAYLLFDFKENFPHYLITVLPHLYAYTADNLRIGGDSEDEDKLATVEAKKILKKYLPKDRYNEAIAEAKDFLRHYKNNS